MKDFPGTPGTLTGLLLRILQCVFAAGSIISMATSSSFFNFTAFCYLIASMGLQVIWSIVLLLLDAYSLMRKKVLNNHVLVSLFVVGDWVTATLSLGAASASGGIVVLYFSDLGHCSFRQECLKYQLSVTLAFLSWLSIAFSSLIMLWILAAGSGLISLILAMKIQRGKRSSFCCPVYLFFFLPFSSPWLLILFLLKSLTWSATVASVTISLSFYTGICLITLCCGIQVMGVMGNKKEIWRRFGEFFSHIFASFHHYMTFFSFE